jgi:hypothetical protein
MNSPALPSRPGNLPAAIREQPKQRVPRYDAEHLPAKQKGLRQENRAFATANGAIQAAGAALNIRLEAR